MTERMRVGGKYLTRSLLSTKVVDLNYVGDYMITKIPAEEIERGVKLIEEEAQILEDMINQFLLKLKTRYQGAMKFTAVSCGLERCRICLGKYKLHYPYIYVASGHSRTYRFRMVRQKELPMFLKQQGFTDKEILEFQALVDQRHALWNVINTLTLLHRTWGLAE